MKHDSAPEDKLGQTEAFSSVSEKRKIEMLEMLHREMDLKYGSSNSLLTKAFGYLWRTTATIVIVFCASWILMPKKHLHLIEKAQQNCLSSPQPKNDDIAYNDNYLDLSLESKKLEMNIDIQYQNNETQIDFDLTGF